MHVRHAQVAAILSNSSHARHSSHGTLKPCAREQIAAADNHEKSISMGLCSRGSWGRRSAA